MPGPVRRLAAHVHRACDGAPIAADRATLWLTAPHARDRRTAIAQRGALVAAGTWAALHLGETALAIGTLAGTAWAYRLGPAGGEPDELAAELPAPCADPRARDLAAIRRAIGDRRGIHLAEIVDRVQAAGIAWEIADVRAWIEGHGVPVRPSLRLGGKAGRVRAGVHIDDLDAATQPAPRSEPDPAPDGVAAGHTPLHPQRHPDLHPAGEGHYTLDDEPVWPGTTPT